MQKQIFKPVSRLQLALQIKSLKSEVKRLKNEIVKKDTLLHKRLCEIAELKNKLEKAGLTFRERIFGRKKEKNLIPEGNKPLTWLQDQIRYLLKQGYTESEIAELFDTTKRNVRRFIKRNGLR